MSSSSRVCPVVGVAMLAVVWTAAAADVGVTGRKLIVIDKVAAANKAKVVFVSKGDPGIEKGSGGDPADLDGTFEVSYESGGSSVDGTFVMPSPWLVNTDTVAKYVNNGAPTTGGAVKVAVVKPGRVAKVVASQLGDGRLIDLFVGQPDAAGVEAVLTLNNRATATRHRMCTRFSVGDGSTVVYKEIAAGMGRKLVLKNGVAGDCPAVVSETVSIPSAAHPAGTPGSSGVDASGYPTLVTEFGTTAVNLNNAIYTRYHREPSLGRPDAVLVLVPGFEAGATAFKILAEEVIEAAHLQGLEVEVWAFDRRSHQLEDREGVRIALQAGDPMIAIDWFFGSELGLPLDPALVAGPNRRAVFHDGNADTAFMANWTSLVFSRDIDAVVEAARDWALNDNVFLGGHSAGTGFAARYAATDFDLTGGGPPQPGYAKLRGLVLLEGGGGSTGAAPTSDTLDRIEDRFDGGMFYAVRDGAARCVDGTPCTEATESTDCAGKGHGTCTPTRTSYSIVTGILNPRILASSEPTAIQAMTDFDSGQSLLSVDFGNGPAVGCALCMPATAGVVPDLATLSLLPLSTAAGAFGSFLDDDGFVSSLAPFVRTSIGAPGPVVGGLTTWLDVGEGPMPASVLPNNGPPPTSLPGTVWGQEKEVTKLQRMIEVFAQDDTNFTDWYYPSAGLAVTQELGLDSTALSVGRGRRDIENLTQAGNIDIPVIAFGGSNGLTPVPGAYVPFAQSIATCAAPSCDGTPRVIDAAVPNPAFPTLGDVAGGFEVHVSEGFAHVDVVTAEAGPDNHVYGPLVDFLARNVQ
jgi:pimeloyl-ACP methyl ester carboxylesterase